MALGMAMPASRGTRSKGEHEGVIVALVAANSEGALASNEEEANDGAANVEEALVGVASDGGEGSVVEPGGDDDTTTLLCMALLPKCSDGLRPLVKASCHTDRDPAGACWIADACLRLAQAFLKAGFPVIENMSQHLRLVRLIRQPMVSATH